MELLANPIWSALTTRQAHLAETSDGVRRFPPDITSLAAFGEPSVAAYASLATLLGGVPAGLFLHSRSAFPDDGWVVLRDLALLQMVHQNGTAALSAKEHLVLGAADSAEMLALAQLTQPGPFGLRTYQLGRYLGVRVEGKLVAMAGERMRVPGYAEISAVCTHPDYVGRGYAARLMTALIHSMRAQGETPFLHVAAENKRAIALYENLGFRVQRRFQLAVVKKDVARSIPA
jgi:ribosomal protein S18 acetylase RimI-like enzyme